MVRNIRAAIVSIAAAGLIAGCGGGTKVESVSTAPAVTTAAQTPSTTLATATASATAVASKVVKPYLDALSARSDPETMRAGLKYAAPGSPAHAYLTHLANLAESRLDGGMPDVDTPVEELGDDSFKSCGDPTDEKSCVTFGSFKINPAGLLVDFTVNKQAMGPRLTVGNGQAVKSAGNTFTFLTAYKSIQSNALFVTIKIQSGSKAISPNIYSATYRSPDGKQRQAADASGSTELDAKSNSVVTVVFPGVAPGGQVTLEGCVGDCMTQFKAVMKVG